MVDDHSSSVKEKQSSFQQKEDDRSSVEEKQNAGSSVKEKQNAGSSVEEKQDDSCNQIFQAEVKPLVDAIFRGTNSCVIACGSSAKTHLIMVQFYSFFFWIQMYFHFFICFALLSPVLLFNFCPHHENPKYLYCA